MKLFDLFKKPINETLKRVKGRWALVSKHDPSKVLQYYHGSGHPSEEWVNKVERRVHSFGEGITSPSRQPNVIKEGSFRDNAVLNQLQHDLRKQKEQLRQAEMNAEVDSNDLDAFQQGLEKSISRKFPSYSVPASAARPIKTPNPWKEGERISTLQDRLHNLSTAIKSHERLDNLINYAEDLGLRKLEYYRDDSHWDPSELWKDNYVSYIDMLEKKIKDLSDRIQLHKSVYKRKKPVYEGMSFSPSMEEPYDDPNGKYKTIWSSVKWQKLAKEPCWACDGTGIDQYRKHTCDRCDGKGEVEEWITDAPTLNVSNSNGYEIQRMLGLNPDYSGVILPADLPKFIRHLIKLKNTSSQQHTQDPSDEMGSMGITGHDQNVTSIGRQGARMIDMGRSQSQVDRYIDELLKMMKFAQEHGAGISWG